MKRWSWVLVATILMALATLWGCSSADPNGSALNRPTDFEANATPKPKGPTAPKQSKPASPSSADAGPAPGSSSAPPPPASDAGASDANVPTNKLVFASMAPMTATAGSPDMTLTVNGSGFGPNTKVQFGAITLASIQSTTTSLSATIPASALQTPGSVDVRVVNGTETAGPVTFTISNAQMTLTSLSPSSAPAGSAAITMRVTGTGFVTNAQVTFNGVGLATTYTSATELSAVIPAPSLATAGTYPVTVKAGTSVTAPLMFTVQSTKPIFDSFSPGSVTAGSPSIAVSIFGRGFTANTKVSVNGYVAPTTVSSSTTARVTVDAYYLRTEGTVALRVYQDTGGPTAVYADGVGYLEVTPPAVTRPTFTSMSPGYAPAGTNGLWITLGGSGFDASTGVSVDGYVADVIVDSSTRVRAWLTAADLSIPGYIRIRVYNALGDGTAYYADAEGLFEVY